MQVLEQKGCAFPELARGPQDAVKFDGLKQKCLLNLQVIKKGSSGCQSPRHRDMDLGRKGGIFFFLELWTLFVPESL